MKEVTGDLVKMAQAGEFDVVIQGCNCWNTQGKGIALQIKKAFPAAYAADLRTARGSMDKLGTFSFACTEQLTVVNAYTQYSYWSSGQEKKCLADYAAIESAFCAIRSKWGGKGLRFGIPRIGAGLAGGDWGKISRIIEAWMEGEDLTLVNWEGEVK